MPGNGDATEKVASSSGALGIKLPALDQYLEELQGDRPLSSVTQHLAQQLARGHGPQPVSTVLKHACMRACSAQCTCLNLACQMLSLSKTHLHANEDACNLHARRTHDSIKKKFASSGTVSRITTGASVGLESRLLSRLSGCCHVVALWLPKFPS